MNAILLPNGLIVRSDNLKHIDVHDEHIPLLLPMLLYIIPQIDEAKRVLDENADEPPR